jgi:hypothetical protein
MMYVYVRVPAIGEIVLAEKILAGYVMSPNSRSLSAEFISTG